MKTISRFWNPIRYVMWIPSHSDQATKPLSLTPLTTPTARLWPIVASSPLSWKRNGSRVPRWIERAACRPCCIATGATPWKLLPAGR